MKKGLLVACAVAVSILGYSQYENTKTIDKLQNKIEYLEEANVDSASNNIIEASNDITYANYLTEVPNVSVETKKSTNIVDKTEPIITTITYKKEKPLANIIEENHGTNVYTTNTGHKYHKAGCRYLKTSCTEITLDQAISMGLTPCKVCKP